jgi:predicted nucleic acid-binding protein
MPDASPTRVVADADVLAADVLVGGASRDALDNVRSHSWLDLVASDHLLDDAHAVVAALADADLADAWRERAATATDRVEHDPGDHSGLASAVHGNAAHLLSFDDALGSVHAGMSVQPHAKLSVRPPDAFARLFDAASLYTSEFEDEYPGPDRDPRN